MDSTGRMRKFQCHPEEDVQRSYTQGDSKHPRTDDHEDEIAEFFALVDQLHATNKLLNKRYIPCQSAEAIVSPGKEDMEAKRIRRKSPWKPSFEWEDFSYGGVLFSGNSGSARATDYAKIVTNTSEDIRNRDSTSREDIAACSSAKCCSVKSMDLNVMAEECEAPQALNLFH